MSQEPPLELEINGVLDWDDNTITTNQPEQSDIGRFLEGGGGTVLPRISRVTLMLEDGGRKFLTNISITGIHQHHGTETTTYDYVKTDP